MVTLAGPACLHGRGHDGGAHGHAHDLLLQLFLFWRKHNYHNSHSNILVEIFFPINNPVREALSC